MTTLAWGGPDATLVAGLAGFGLACCGHGCGEGGVRESRGQGGDLTGETGSDRVGG